MIFNTTQVPIQEPMYVNGHLSQVWHMFFLRLSQVAAVDDDVDLTDITSLAHQMPTQAAQGQMLIELNTLKDTQPTIQPQATQKQTLQPLQAVFLCPDQYAPLASIHTQHQPFAQPINLPSSEVLHDSV